MSHDVLTIETVSTYLRSLGVMHEVFSRFDNLEVVKVGDGNLNFVYLITNRVEPTETVALKQAVARFINPELCKLTEDFVFTHPFERNETTSYNEKLTEEDLNFIHCDGELKVAVAEMKYIFMNNAEAMLHGDFHPGSIMANEKETIVIDPEFAFYPMSFDIGTFIDIMLMAYFSQEFWQQKPGREPLDQRSLILHAISSTWNQLTGKFDALWEKHQNAKDPRYFDYPERKTQNHFTT